MGNPTSGAAVSAVRFEARIWRDAYHIQPTPHCDYNDLCKTSKTTAGTCLCTCYDCQRANAKPNGEDVPPSWAIYATDSGVRMAYAKSKEDADKTADKWNAGKVPEQIKAKADSCVYLRSILKPGDTVNTILRTVSRSGMSRRISLVIARNNEVEDITWEAARAMGDPIKQGGKYVQDAGMVVNGCGMDMGFHIVYSLSRTLFADGFPVSEGIAPIGKKMQTGLFRGSSAKPLTAQDMAKYVRKGWKFRGRNGDPSGWDNDGGYALKQRWM